MKCDKCGYSSDIDFAHVCPKEKIYVEQGTWMQTQIEISTLKAQLAEAEKDSSRLDWIEQKATVSRTGISIDYTRHVADGYVTEKGFRFMSWHAMTDFCPTTRKAIDAAIKEQS